MADMLENQIRASLAIQRAEEAINNCIFLLKVKYTGITELDGDRFVEELTQLCSTARSLGRLEEIHENLLKDDQRNTEKEGRNS